MKTWTDYSEQLADCAKVAGIGEEPWETFLEYVVALHDHNPVHACHSLRVGLYAFGLAQHEGLEDLKYPLYAGTAHDVGKCDILNEVIDHPNFGPEQMRIMRAHPQFGFDRLKQQYLFTAFIAGLHHKFQPDGYGIDLADAAPFKLSSGAKVMIVRMAKLVMICDFYDAVTTREGPNRERVAETMREHFPTRGVRVDWLLEHPV